MKTINITELQTFLIAFYNQEFPEQRLGQAFMNVMKLTETNTDIFYEPDNITAIQKIYNQYISK